MSELYDRSTTGNVDRVEVEVLSYGERRGSKFSCTQAQGEEIARLWRTLPEAEQVRCHIPAYGLRFYAGRVMFQPVLLLEASLCWQCNNIHLRTRGRGYYSTFDSAHPDSQRLLDILKDVAGPAGAGQELDG